MIQPRHCSIVDDDRADRKSNRQPGCRLVCDERKASWVDRAQRISQATELWKGSYNDKVVALKIVRVPQEDPHLQTNTNVSCGVIPRWELIIVVLTDGI